MSKKEPQAKPEKAAPKFTKQQFLKAANFSQVERDVLRALMKDDESYTLDQAKKLVDDFSKRKVK